MDEAQLNTNDMEAKIKELLTDRDRLEKLLSLEKARRGISKESLLFVGMANVAQYYWCAMQAVLKSQRNELEFFAAYLHDRIKYSQWLGLIGKLPKSHEAILNIGNEITLRDVEELLREKAERDENSSFGFLAETRSDEHGSAVMIVSPDLPPEGREWFERLAKARDVRLADPEEFPKLRGRLLQTTKAERYSTIRWSFDWEGYVVVGVPDGITDSFVYEFKTTRNRFLMTYFVKRVAFAQADLYGYFFRRDRRRVQIYIKDEGTTATWEDKVNTAEAIGVLRDFGKVVTGWMPPPPKTWKCKSCEHRDMCKIIVSK